MLPLNYEPHDERRDTAANGAADDRRRTTMPPALQYKHLMRPTISRRQGTISSSRVRVGESMPKRLSSMLRQRGATVFETPSAESLGDVFGIRNLSYAKTIQKFDQMSLPLPYADTRSV